MKRKFTMEDFKDGLNLLIEDGTINPICMDCAKPYKSFPLDVTLNEEDWLKIHPDRNGLLCANCIVERASKLSGVIAVRAKIEFAEEATAQEKVLYPSKTAVFWCSKSEEQTTVKCPVQCEECCKQEWLESQVQQKKNRLF